MKLRIKSTNVKKFQEGGMVAPEEEVNEIPVQETEQAAPEAQDPMMQLLQMCQQAISTNDCQMALQICDALLQIATQQSQANQAPVEETQPVYAKGGKLLRRVRK